MSQSSLSPFHLAIPVDNLSVARTFYGEVMGFEEGRSSEHWVDFNCFGHQLVIHYHEHSAKISAHNEVDGKSVPIPHFGVLLEWSEWEKLAERLTAKNVEFEIAPYVRFKGEVGEQGTLFFYDPCGNALEFKTFKDMSRIFAK
ncbi:VOC family protein [Aquimarina sp. ERC-38]|uniref:VOC family protein n=1 Tax=Aquimarina sp. ERC-38 TaxID=2949996 RepID=UPI002247F157|nr:VOC family protein [Aquimarina sp. ERC-38]UZO80514.1 VOC family protein [Aquimarina sp. ERC-38]